MAVDKIYAQLSCADLPASLAWYGALFGRRPDARPMDGLAEWHLRDCAGLQLFQSPAHAGHGTLTLVVHGLRNEHARLQQAGLTPGGIEPATSSRLVRLRDPDGNQVVLAEPCGPSAGPVE